MNDRYDRISWGAVAAACVVAVAYFGLVFIPGRRAAEQLRGENTDRKLFVAAAENIDAPLAAARAELAELDAYCTNWKGRLCRPDRLAEFFGQIHDCATAAGVSFERFEPQQQEILSRMRKVPVDLRCQGGFDEVWRLIWKIESLPGVIRIDRATIGIDEQSGKTIKCDVGLVAFSQEDGSFD